MSLLSMHYSDWERIAMNLHKVVHFSTVIINTLIHYGNLLNVNNILIFFPKSVWTSNQNISHCLWTNENYNC